MRRMKRSVRRKQKRRARHTHLLRYLMFLSTTSHLCGQRNLQSALNLNISSSIIQYLTTAGILCSGSTLTWIILLLCRVSFISRRRIMFISHLRDASRSTITRSSSQTTSRRSFLISCSFCRDALTAQISRSMFHVRHCSRMNMLRSSQATSSRRFPISSTSSSRSKEKTSRSTGLTSPYSLSTA